MPLFKYAGDAGRYYADLGLTPEPDAAYELDEAPDHRFVEVTTEDATELARVEAERLEAERLEAERLAAEANEPSSDDDTEGK